MESAAVTGLLGEIVAGGRARSSLEQQLRGAVWWGGAGCVWTSLPLGREGEVLRELDVLERSAVAVADALRASRQQTIPGTDKAKPN